MTLSFADSLSMDGVSLSLKILWNRCSHTEDLCPTQLDLISQTEIVVKDSTWISLLIFFLYSAKMYIPPMFFNTGGNIKTVQIGKLF